MKDANLASLFLVKEVGVGVFDAVVVGNWEVVRVRVVDSGGVVGHGARPGDPEDAAGEGALLAPEADAELDAEVAFFVAPGVDAVGAGQRVRAGDQGEMGDGAHAADADLMGVGVDAHEGVGELDNEAYPAGRLRLMGSRS